MVYALRTGALGHRAVMLSTAVREEVVEWASERGPQADRDGGGRGPWLLAPLHRFPDAELLLAAWAGPPSRPRWGQPWEKRPQPVLPGAASSGACRAGLGVLHRRELTWAMGASPGHFYNRV